MQPSHCETNAADALLSMSPARANKIKDRARRSVRPTKLSKRRSAIQSADESPTEKQQVDAPDSVVESLQAQWLARRQAALEQRQQRRMLETKAFLRTLRESMARPHVDAPVADAKVAPAAEPAVADMSPRTSKRTRAAPNRFTIQ